MDESKSETRAGYEESDVDARSVTRFGAVLFAVAAAAFVLSWALLRFLAAEHSRADRRPPPLAAVERDRVPPEPRLQVSPREDLRRVRESEDQVLRSYGWVDKEARVVRIPIDRAMDLLAERGLPARGGH